MAPTGRPRTPNYSSSTPIESQSSTPGTAIASGKTQCEKEKAPVPPVDSQDSDGSLSARGGSIQEGKESWKTRLYDWINWMPARCRWDTETPPPFTMGLNILYAFAALFTVSNLYYNQPILNKIAEEFNVSFEESSTVATLMQSGYAGGLLLICPLGDIFRRRPFILSLIAFTATMWLGLCLTSSFPAFQALSFICGFTTVTPQLLLPLVGDLAPAHRRATYLSVVVSGLMLGMLVARLLAGIIANYTDWRNIYWFSFGVQYIILAALWAFMPDYPSKNPQGINYFKVLGTIFHLMFTEPLLLQTCGIALFGAAVFTSFWTTLTFLLALPPYEYNSLVIGFFSLIGIVAVVGGPIYSRLVVDKLIPLVSVIIGQVAVLIGVLIGTLVGTWNVAGPVLQAIAIDIGLQTSQTANRSAIYGIRPTAQNRINTAYMLSVFCGQLMGTSVGNKLFANRGWEGSGWCSFGLTIASLLICVVRGPKETRWVGWRGGWGWRRTDLPLEKKGQGDIESASGETSDAPLRTHEISTQDEGKK
ncbi:putative transporter [Zalerion maritima]|uniref:Transporter n=1 Tax=Zalerion maritima TaxID=339359 RepID=A0AAD5RM66_9PEZI|nr:putative transporter [Zalerion maritima]